MSLKLRKGAFRRSNISSVSSEAPTYGNTFRLLEDDEENEAEDEDEVEVRSLFLLAIF